MNLNQRENELNATIEDTMLMNTTSLIATSTNIVNQKDLAVHIQVQAVLYIN